MSKNFACGGQKTHFHNKIWMKFSQNWRFLFHFTKTNKKHCLALTLWEPPYLNRHICDGLLWATITLCSDGVRQKIEYLDVSTDRDLFISEVFMCVWDDFSVLWTLNRLYHTVFIIKSDHKDNSVINDIPARVMPKIRAHWCPPPRAWFPKG